VTRQARNLLMTLEDHAAGTRFVTRDRDAKLTAASGAVLAAVGMQLTVPDRWCADQSRAFDLLSVFLDFPARGHRGLRALRGGEG